jgi:hypothetical protein
MRRSLPLSLLLAALMPGLAEAVTLCSGSGCDIEPAVPPAEVLVPGDGGANPVGGPVYGDFAPVTFDFRTELSTSTFVWNGYLADARFESDRDSDTAADLASRFGLTAGSEVPVQLSLGLTRLSQVGFDDEGIEVVRSSHYRLTGSGLEFQFGAISVNEAAPSFAPTPEDYPPVPTVSAATSTDPSLPPLYLFLLGPFVPSPFDPYAITGDELRATSRSIDGSLPEELEGGSDSGTSFAERISVLFPGEVYPTGHEPRELAVTLVAPDGTLTDAFPDPAELLAAAFAEGEFSLTLFHTATTAPEAGEEGGWNPGGSNNTAGSVDINAQSNSIWVASERVVLRGRLTRDASAFSIDPTVTPVTSDSLAPVPVPGALWLLTAALSGLPLVGRRR